ncbi:MAG TPA: heavy metal-binding domain-containing protein [bacterium]
MKKLILVILTLALVVGGATWWKSHRGAAASGSQVSDILYWTCVMHPFIHKDGPGKCPICSMDLVPKRRAELTPTPSTTTSSAGRKIKYWADAMNPSRHSDHPGKAPDGMDLVPVYEEGDQVKSEGQPEALKGLAPVQLDSFKRQTIGIKLVQARRVPVTRLIRTSGRFGGGGDDFAAAAAAFTSGEPLHQSLRGQGRYVIADVYALDQPFVKVGEKAWISPFSGSGSKVEGRVAQVYPYDGTLSRVGRVRLQLMGPAPNELYANVEIEAATPPLMSVPREAVLSTGTRNYVFVEEGEGHFTPRLVTVGFLGDENCEITSGLKEGEKVVWGGNFLLDADSHILAGSQE